VIKVIEQLLSMKLKLRAIVILRTWFDSLIVPGDYASQPQRVSGPARLPGPLSCSE
jgi:hypothetical protein